MKGNHRNGSDPLSRGAPLGGNWFRETYLVRRVSSMGDDCTLCTPPSSWLPWQTPPSRFSSLTFPSSSLLGRKCQQFLRRLGLLCLASLQHLGPDLQRFLSSSPPPAWPLFWGCCCFPPFPPGEEQFPNAGMELEHTSNGLSRDTAT